MRRAKVVGGSDSVFSRIDCSHVDNVKSDISKVIIGSEPGTDGDGTSVEEPFYPHCRIPHRLQAAFQMNVFSFGHWFRVLQWLDKNRLRFADLFNVILRLDEFRIFKALGFLICPSVHAGCVNAGPSCRIKTVQFSDIGDIYGYDKGINKLAVANASEGHALVKLMYCWK